MYLEISPEVLLALMSAKLEPLLCCSDGRWRSVSRLVPVDGITREEINQLLNEGLAERRDERIVLTKSGVNLLNGGVCISRRPERSQSNALH